MKKKKTPKTYFQAGCDTRLIGDYGATKKIDAVTWISRPLAVVELSTMDKALEWYKMCMVLQ